MEAIAAGITLVLVLAVAIGVRLHRRRQTGQTPGCEHCADQKAEIEHPIS